ncbi:MAG: HAMP domain-containing protein [Planctomycetes bacterium]|nr:HAMP domain-containing protein [Planctomycetota bacterium]
MRESKPRANVPELARQVTAFVRGLSLKHKLIAIIMLTCVVSLTLVGVVFAAWERAALRHALVRDLSAHADVLADNCKAAITFRDPADASGVLRTVGAIPSILTACVYTSDGELFAAHRRKGATVALPRPAPARDGREFDWRSLVLTKPVLLDGESIGTVCLRADLTPLHTRLKHSFTVILCLVLACSLAAYLISSRLQGLISAPILHLADVAHRVSEKKEYTVRAVPTGRDEVGLLIETFNQMLGQIEQRDAALVEANEGLEARVGERTGELRAANEKLTREVATRRQIELALAEANEHLAETVQSLRRSNKELQDFAYVAAHDLKAPLRGIGTLADWIASDYAGQFDEQGRQQLRLLKGRVTRLTELINGILHYAEISRGTPRRETVDLDGLLAETIGLLDPPSHIQVVVQPELPAVAGDKVRLGQVFRNLIDNAIKYMDKPQGRIEIGCTDRDRFWEFAVTDNGPGIEAKYFEKIFQMFQTLAPRDQRESTGIGLPIVKKIVELFGGRIWVESKPGQGSTFFFTLPKHEGVIESRALVLEGASAS